MTFSYNFLVKELGKLDPNFLKQLQKEIINLPYKEELLPGWLIKGYQFSSEHPFFLKIFHEHISNYFDINSHVETFVHRMEPFTYWAEHSDYWWWKDSERIINPSYKEQHHHKIIIPIIADNAAMMWRQGRGHTSKVHILKEGSLYAFDNIKLHCSVNLSPNYRYVIVTRYKEKGLINQDFLKGEHDNQIVNIGAYVEEGSNLISE